MQQCFRLAQLFHTEDTGVHEIGSRIQHAIETEIDIGGPPLTIDMLAVEQSPFRHRATNGEPRNAFDQHAEPNIVKLSGKPDVEPVEIPSSTNKSIDLPTVERQHRGRLDFRSPGDKVDRASWHHSGIENLAFPSGLILAMPCHLGRNDRTTVGSFRTRLITPDFLAYLRRLASRRIQKLVIKTHDAFGLIHSQQFA